MTTAQLRARLASELSPELGTYTLDGGLVQPAIRVGDPPKGTVTGLEVRINELPDYEGSSFNSHRQATETHRVYLIAHGSPPNISNLRTAARKLETGYEASSTPIEENERLGILPQYVFVIRS